jgi:hypothetical protein
MGPWGAVALAVAFTLLCVGVLVTMGPMRATPAKVTPTEPPSLSAIKTEQLLRLNATLESDPALADEYQAINSQYFSNRLPSVRVRWEPRLDEIGPLIAEGFRLEGVTNGHVVLLNPSLQGDAPQFRRVLCHEVVHVALTDRSDGHGPKFQALLARLSNEGAFEGVVATDEERADLRASLERRSEEMDRESSHLRAAWSEIDGTDATRVQEYNTRVRRLREASADFDRRAAQYNLMISYPDGLDEERLARRASSLSTR